MVIMFQHQLTINNVSAQIEKGGVKMKPTKNEIITGILLSVFFGNITTEKALSNVKEEFIFWGYPVATSENDE